MEPLGDGGLLEFTEDEVTNEDHDLSKFSSKMFNVKSKGAKGN